ncbi:MAG: metallophosphoesterase [Muribaculaceae bacterium]|nr:metallophosphoesterase [Muribaculaceae bacterium]
MAFGFTIVVLGIILLLSDCYIAFGVLNDSAWWWKVLVFIPGTIYLTINWWRFSGGKINQWTMNFAIRSTLIVFFSTLIFTIVSVLGWCLGWANPILWTIFNWIALGCCGIWLMAVLYGIFIGWKKVTVEKISLNFSDLPSKFKGYKIVHLSDFHIGTYSTSPITVSEIVEKVNSLNSDLIVFTGDLVNTSSEEIIPFINELRSLKAKDGVISVLGNHDYCLYRSYTPPDSPQKELEKVINLEKSAGWKLLLNESIQIERGGERMAIIGVENAGGKSFTDRADLQKAMKGLTKDEFKILLSHDPSHWRREILSATNIDLTLSGHTHGMQFKIGRFSPAKWAYKEWGGIYSEGARKLVVNTGTGGNVAFRLGVYPQILEITLTNS